MNKIFNQYLAVWIGLALAASLALSMLFPTPHVIFLIWIIFIYISWLLGKLTSKRTNFPNSSSNSGIDDIVHRTSIVIRYRCIICGHYHNEKSCPKFGSKMKKAS